MLPYKNKHPLRSVGIPSLSGGVNLRDGLTQVNDNQLTDVKNMWFKDGMLKTRPGVEIKNALSLGRASDQTLKNRVFDEIKIYLDDKAYVLAVTTRFYLNLTAEEDTTIFLFSWQGYSTINLPFIAAKGKVECFVIEKDRTLYCFLSDYTIYKLKYPDKNPQEDKNWSNWELLSDKEVYAPLIATNYHVSFAPDGGCIPPISNVFNGATMVEGFNLLGRRFRLIGPTVSYEFHSTSNGVSEYAMSYLVPYAAKVFDYIQTLLEVKITWDDGKNVTHTATELATDSQNNTYYFEEKSLNPDDNLKMQVYKVNDNYIQIRFCESDGSIKSLIASNYIANNMEIIAPCVNTEENMKKVFNMTRAEWFGGASAGLNGGTRLFLGGNTNENEKSLIIWSDLNKPLYFPENNYAYVGNANIPVTGFGKQNDMLVIFKAFEIFATQYVQNTDITAESLINQSVVDIAANSAFFPLIQIHSGVGCDLPDTVRLCRNRLVWATKQGKVYTLVSQSQYNERNVFEISEMIERKLKGALNEYAHAVDYEGYYMLFCGNKAFVCDYNSYGYIYAASHSKTEDANIRIPWYYWELDFSDIYADMRMFVLKDSLMLYGSLNFSSATDVQRATFVFEDNLQDGILYEDKSDYQIKTVYKPIPTSFTTKAFDFGAPQYEKHIPQIHIAFGDNGGEPINISFVTDTGETEGETVYIPSDNSDMRDSTYLKSTVIRPNVRFVRHFGVKVQCEGAMAVGDVSLNYRIQGEVK